MRIFTLASALGNYRDRGAIPIGGGSETSAVPGVPVAQLSYIVPANRAAVIEVAACRVIPEATLPVGTFVDCTMITLFDGGGGSNIYNLRLFKQEGPDVFYGVAPVPFSLFAGDQFRMQRAGGGTPPTVAYAMWWHGVEDDA